MLSGEFQTHSGEFNMQFLYSISCRLETLEKKVLVEGGAVPDVVFEMKQKVDDFRERLQVCMCIITKNKRC